MTEDWLLDSGASDSMSPVASDFVLVAPPVSREHVRIADGTLVPVLGVGTVLLQGLRGPFLLRGVLFVPGLSQRLLSVAMIYDHGGRVEWGRDEVLVYGSGTDYALARCHREYDRWVLRAPILSASVVREGDHFSLQAIGEGMVVQGAGPSSVSAPWELWHARLGHVGVQALRRMSVGGHVTGMQLTGSTPKSHVCPDCLVGKMANLPFPAEPRRAQQPFSRICMDLLGKVTTSSRSKSKYMLCLKDEYSGYAWVYFLRKKKEAATRIRSFFAFVERQYEVTVKGFRSDRGGEFLHHDFVQWLEELWVTHQLTTPYTPQQNGMCERYNRTLCDRARAMLSAAGLPQRY